MAQIERTGVVSFGDASLAVWEEGIANARADGGYKAAQEWERQFKKDVLLRIVQMLNRLGWTCSVPQEYIEQYSLDFARNHRECSKGDLRGWLDLSGRHIEFEMWQGVNTPTRPDRGGRHESDKEGCAPYLLRLEMFRTRNRIRDYLCNVFTGYTFDNKHRSIYRKPLAMTAMERVQQEYAESRHFKGDWQAELAKPHGVPDYDRKSADGILLEHGQRVWFFDRRGRIATGIAHYRSGGMWRVVTGKYDIAYENNHELFTTCPENYRIKRNADIRRKRLESELAKATKAMDFERATQVRDILFPKAEPLFVVWHKDHKAYHCANFQGYTTNIIDAGKFIQAELKGYTNDPNEVRPLQAA